MGCSTARNAATCTNGRTISTFQLESRVLDALKNRLFQPDLVSEFVDEYRRATDGVRRQRAAARSKASARIGRLTDMMADGVGDHAEMKQRLASALTERARASLDEERSDDDVQDEAARHPGLATAYRRNVEALVETFHAPEMAGKTRLALRNLVGLITAEPHAGREVWTSWSMAVSPRCSGQQKTAQTLIRTVVCLRWLRGQDLNL